MGFSYRLEINGIEYTSFGNLKSRESVDGFGFSGVSTREFTFTLAYDEAKYIAPMAQVWLITGVNYQLVSGFIVSRQRRGKTVSFKCYDRIIYTDQVINFSESSFRDGMISVYDAFSTVSGQCGFDGGLHVISGVELPPFNIPREKVEGRTGREILEMISKVWCGVFHTDDNERLLFLPVEASRGGADSGLLHAPIIEGNSKGPIEAVVMSNGSEEFRAGRENADVFHTIKISSDLASAELAGHLFNRLEGYTYNAWECSKLTYGVSTSVASVIALNADITFGDGVTRKVNYAEKSYIACGVFAKCGANNFSESEFEYVGNLSRQIANKIGDGEELGNKTLITRYQGTIHLGEKKSGKGRAAEDPPKRYGYAPATYEGVVKFDGAMVDKTLPKITVKDDLSGFSTVYGDTVIDYELDWNGDNVTLKEKEAAQ